MNISTDIPLTQFTAALLRKLTAEAARDHLGVVNDKRYIHTQGVASSTWVITHNLDYDYPTVRVFDGDTEIFGRVAYTDSNTVTITFLGPYTGIATIN